MAASTTAARPSAVQVEIQCANSVLIGVRRVDGVGNPVQVRHHLLVGPAVSKDQVGEALAWPVQHEHGPQRQGGGARGTRGAFGGCGVAEK